MSQIQISFVNNTYTVEGYCGQKPAPVVPSGVREVKLIRCSFLPQLPESLVRLSLERCDIGYYLGELPALTALYLKSSTLALSGTRPADTEPVQLTAVNSAILDEGMTAPAGGTERLLYVLDYQSALLSSHLSGSHYSLSYQLKVSEAEACQLSGLSEAGVWRVPACRVFYLPRGWTAEIAGNPVVVLSQTHDSLPKGARRVLLANYNLYLEDTADLEELLVISPYCNEYLCLYPGIQKTYLKRVNIKSATIHYGGAGYQVGEQMDEMPLPAEEQTRLRRRLALLCPPTGVKA